MARENFLYVGVGVCAVVCFFVPVVINIPRNAVSGGTSR